jgi:hypothetical protein
MLMRNITDVGQLKLHILRSAICLSGGNPQEVVKSDFCKCVAAELGVEVNSLSNFVPATFRSIGSSNSTTLHLVKFIEKIRGEIIKADKVASGAVVSDEVKGAKAELGRIFALFQLALVAHDDDECTVTKLHIPAFVSVLNSLQGAGNVYESGKSPVNSSLSSLSEGEISGLEELLERRLENLNKKAK